MKKKHTFHVLALKSNKNKYLNMDSGLDGGFKKASRFISKKAAAEQADALEFYRQGFYKPVKVSCSLEE